MDLALGLAMSATSVRFLLAEGSDGCGATLEHDQFEVSRAGGVSAPSISEHVVAVVLGTQAIAAARSHTLVRVGITWTADVETEASMVLESLNCLGIDNVVAVPMLDAAEAFACRIAVSHGSGTTAVFIIEADSAVTTTVTNDCADISHIASQVYSGRFVPGEALRSLAVSMFAHLADRPEALFVAGAGGDFDEISAQLDEVSQLPVLVPAEAGLALARGAAIAAAKPALAAVAPAGPVEIEEITCPEAALPAAGDGFSLPLLFVPRTARLAMLDELPKVEAAPTIPEAFRNRRAVTSAHVLTAVLVGAVVTFLVSTTLAFSNRTDDNLSSPAPSESGASRLTGSSTSPAPPITQPGALAAGQPGAQTAKPLFIPGLSGFSPGAPAPAAPVPASAAPRLIDDERYIATAPPVATPPKTPATAKRPAAPDVVGLLMGLFNGPSPIPNVRGVPSDLRPPGLPVNAQAGPNSPVAIYEPLMLTLSDLARTADANPNLPTAPNPSGAQ